MFPMRTSALAATLAATLAWASAGWAQDAAQPKDEALDRLIETLDDAQPRAKPASGAVPSRSQSRSKPKPAAKAKAAETPAPPKPETHPAAGAVAPKDQAIDQLLEKLGETRETPSPDDPRGGKPKSADEPAHEPSPSQPEPRPKDALQGKAKELDEHLEELTGRKKKRDRDEQGEGSGPLSKIIKEMRDVEQRLGKPDTGEETRQKQTQIVKELDRLIDQLRSASSQSQGKRRLRLVNQAGQKPGQQDGQSQGANAGGAPNTRPVRPTGKHSLAGGTGQWGHLPPELRQEMDNVAKEEPMTSKQELIRLYYLSLTKKTLVRGE
jgi:hypothetical protein